MYSLTELDVIHNTIKNDAIIMLFSKIIASCLMETL